MNPDQMKTIIMEIEIISKLFLGQAGALVFHHQHGWIGNICCCNFAADTENIVLKKVKKESRPNG
jgi:hypothetical protein